MHCLDCEYFGRTASAPRVIMRWRDPIGVPAKNRRRRLAPPGKPKAPHRAVPRIVLFDGRIAGFAVAVRAGDRIGW